MENNIIRKYPTFKDEKLYKVRYNKEDFEKYKEITKSIENYEKWKIGINYKTNRKLKIGGKTHRNLGYENFYIKHGTTWNYSYILFTELDGIDVELYIQETEKLKKEIEDYNLEACDVIKKINLLEKWEEYVVFKGIKYGIPYVYNNIHRGNNCFGLIIEDYYKECSCHCCEDWGGCSNPESTQYYRCKKCDYKYSKSIIYSKNYKGK
tara:strand:+ start:608 stop:1231 length:624 start_codon:yes stop_codon:yes gene_type:complete